MKEESISEMKSRIIEIIKVLENEYPDAKCSLNFTTPHELMVAAILAAQCTDERVNEITPILFKKYPTVADFANAKYDELEGLVRPTGFFRNKTKAIIESAQQLIADYDGIVPDDIDKLIKLSGVGRKTANLVVGVSYGKPAIIVDTHVKRVSGRLGLTKEKDPAKIEKDLAKILSVKDSTRFNHLIVYHGRAVCKAPTPKCEICSLLKLCPFGSAKLGVKSH